MSREVGPPGQRSDVATDVNNPSLEDHVWDVVVVGGGNAGLVAAIVARERGLEVLVLEAAPPEMRAGNTRHTRNIRCAHSEPTSSAQGTYTTDELYEDLCSVGARPVDETLARLTVVQSATIPDWMTGHGVRWQPPLRGVLNLNRTNHFFLGGGRALANHYYWLAERKGVRVRYKAKVTNIELQDNLALAVIVSTGTLHRRIRARAFILACGGFEANRGLLERYWGSAAANFVVRGTPFNDGTVLSLMTRAGAETAGDGKGFHAIAVDARSPMFDGGISTRVDCIPFGVVVNMLAQRFADEGEEIWPKRYASWGQLIASQPNQTAVAIYDSKVRGRFVPSVYPPYESDSIEGLALMVGLPRQRLTETIANFNSHVTQGSAFNPNQPDWCTTVGLEPAKSNWALRIDKAPYFAIPLRPGVTFTFLGLAIDSNAQVRMRDSRTFRNVYAAGEVMSGNVLSGGYLAGFGLAIGTVFGRIAGSHVLMTSAL